LVRQFRGHTGPISDMQISEDCRWLLTSSIDGTVRCWDIPGGGRDGTVQHIHGVVCLLLPASFFLLPASCFLLPASCCHTASFARLLLPACLCIQVCTLPLHRAKMVVSFV